MDVTAVGVLLEDDAECARCGEAVPVLLTPDLTVLIDEHGSCRVTTVEVPR